MTVLSGPVPSVGVVSVLPPVAPSTGSFGNPLPSPESVPDTFAAPTRPSLPNPRIRGSWHKGTYPSVRQSDRGRVRWTLTCVHRRIFGHGRASNVCLSPCSQGSSCPPSKVSNSFIESLQKPSDPAPLSSLRRDNGYPESFGPEGRRRPPGATATAMAGARGLPSTRPPFPVPPSTGPGGD